MERGSSQIYYNFALLDSENSGLIPTPDTREATNLANVISMSISSSSSASLLQFILFVAVKSHFTS